MVPGSKVFPPGKLLLPTCSKIIATARSRTSPRRPVLLHSGWGQGVCIGDYDNDGYEDLFVTYFGKNVLYHQTMGMARSRT